MSSDETKRKRLDESDTNIEETLTSRKTKKIVCSPNKDTLALNTKESMFNSTQTPLSNPKSGLNVSVMFISLEKKRCLV